MKDKEKIEEKLWEVHEALIEHFLDILKNKEEAPKGSTLDVIRAFLKDNAITRAETKKSSPLDYIGDILENWSAEEYPTENDEKHKDSGGNDDGLKVAQ